MALDLTTITGILSMGIMCFGVGFAIALIYLGAQYEQDKEEEFGETCTKTKHLWQLDPSKEINYCFCGQESWKVDEHHLIMIKS